MTALAPHLTAFLREHLPHERKASPNTALAGLPVELAVLAATIDLPRVSTVWPPLARGSPETGAESWLEPLPVESCPTARLLRKIAQLIPA